VLRSFPGDSLTHFAQWHLAAARRIRKCGREPSVRTSAIWRWAITAHLYAYGAIRSHRHGEHFMQFLLRDGRHVVALRHRLELQPAHRIVVLGDVEVESVIMRDPEGNMVPKPRPTFSACLRPFIADASIYCK
jgi:hypothetical protein